MHSIISWMGGRAGRAVLVGGALAWGAPACADAMAMRNRSREAFWVECPRTPEAILVTQMLGSGEIRPTIRFSRDCEVGFVLPARGVAWIEMANPHLSYCNDFQIKDCCRKERIACFNYQVVVTRKLATLKSGYRRIRLLGGEDGSGQVKVNAAGNVLIIGEVSGPRARGLSPRGSSASGRSAAAE